jgi:hypothetical protein
MECQCFCSASIYPVSIDTTISYCHGKRYGPISVSMAFFSAISSAVTIIYICSVYSHYQYMSSWQVIWAKSSVYGRMQCHYICSDHSVYLQCLLTLQYSVVLARIRPNKQGIEQNAVPMFLQCEHLSSVY